MNCRCDSPARRIEVERVHQPQLDVLTGCKRLMRVGKRHQGLTSIFEIDMILIAEVLDAVHETDDGAAVPRFDLQVLGSDSDGLSPRRHRDL
jgi:hypothetical protein